MVIYLDTNDDDTIGAVLRNVVDVRVLSGYEGDEWDIDVQRGSIFRRSRVSAGRRLSAREALVRLAKLERALELAAVDRRQAEFDSAEAAAVASLLDSLRDIPRACIRLGSILLLKYPAPSGETLIVSRTLTRAEITACERFPEIQKRPENALAALATAVETMAVDKLTLEVSPTTDTVG